MTAQQEPGQSAELTGGAGFTFEDAVAAIYLASLLDENTAPGLPGRTVTRVATQQANYDEPLDDLIVDARGQNGEEIRLSLQVKRAITVSSAKSNSDFRQVVLQSYETIENSNFRNGIDRVGVATGTISDQAKRRLEAVCEWARDCPSDTAFSQRLANGSQQHRDVVTDFKKILRDKLTSKTEGAEIYRLLKHFVLVQFDLLHEGSVVEASTVALLRHSLHEDDAERADDLWRRLRLITREGAGRSAEFIRRTLIERLYGSFRFQGALSFRQDLARLKEEARLTIADIAIDINGVVIHRQNILNQIKDNIGKHRFIQIIGLPGTGKSGVFRWLAQEYFDLGSVLVLKADRLAGTSWLSYSRSLGSGSSPLEDLLVEIAVTGSPVLLIDGLDRIEISAQKIILDIVNTILKSPTLSAQWSIIATLRDSGIEPIRNWMPGELFCDDGIATIEVKPFSDEEAQLLATQRPALRPLLFGEERLREIARRPFFASVLAKTFAFQPTNSQVVPRSEVDLIDVWWSRGGLNNEPSSIVRCQRTLIQLAKLGANTLGRRIRLNNLDLDAVTRLKTDGILQDVRNGHSVKFSHDIFFEWAFLQSLLDCEENWLDEIQAIGEPPVLGRTVELLSQYIFLNDDNWAEHLERTENSLLRPQWIRSWLLGPLGIPDFLDREEAFSEAVLLEPTRRLAKLACWFQAEKTRANPVILENAFVSSQLSAPEIIRMADALAWPSDFEAWYRCCHWLLNHVSEFSIPLLPDILSVFEVWQNVFADIPNPTSSRMLELVKLWLEEIEDCRHSEVFNDNYGRWDALRGGGLEDFEKRLRSLFLRSARSSTEHIEQYLDRLISGRRLRSSVFEEIIPFSPILAETCPTNIAELASKGMLGALPQEVADQPRGNRISSPSFSSIHWRDLAINSYQRVFHPPSPLREPFHSLFQKAPAEALTLVRAITNHAITAWRQLFELDWERKATPIPIVLTFPWGEQTFWGDDTVYVWFRGLNGSDPIEAGLMALEKWAFSQINDGRDPDDVICDVVFGHESCAVLGVASSIALSSQKISKTTLPILTSQRLWKWDIRRYRQDSGSHTNLIGFSAFKDQKHLEAVQESNNQVFRKLDLRAIAQIAVIHHDQELREEAQSAIQAFPNDLPYEVEESREDTAKTNYLRETAEIWAELGKPQNYQLKPVEDGLGLQLEVNNPKNSEPAMIEFAQQYAERNNRLRFLLWIDNSLKSQSVDKLLTVSDALEGAKSLDNADLFIRPHHQLDFDNQSQAIVAGVAAVALHLGGIPSEEFESWAEEVILRAAYTPENQGEMWTPYSLPMHHPCMYAVSGLVALIKRGSRVLEAKQALVNLANHPLDQVSVAAIGSSLELWSLDAEFSWLMLSLAINLSIEIRDFGEEEPCEEPVVSEYVTDPIGQALACLDQSLEVPVHLAEIPDPWIFAPPPLRRDFSGQLYGSEEPVWREPDIFLAWDYLAKFLWHVPVSDIMSDALRRPVFLSFTKSLVNWTIEKLSPSWANEEQKREIERRTTNLLEWKNHFSQFSARVLLFTDIDEAKEIYLDVLFSLESEVAASLMSPFLSTLTYHIMDSPELPRHALSLIEVCLPGILEYENWEDARHRDGRLSNFDVPNLVKTLLFVDVEEAMGAVRFANNDWRDITDVMSIIDPFVRSVGDVADVTSIFLTLCERSIDYYPADIFVSQTAGIFGEQADIPTGWRGSNIPIRIASLIQSFADREHPLDPQLSQQMLRVLDKLVDMGVRRAAALQISEAFKDVRIS